MSSYSTLFGGASVPIGAIVQGQFASDSNYLPCDGKDYLSANYPLLDKSKLETFGSNQVTQRSMTSANGLSLTATNGTIVVAIGAATTTNSIQSSTDGVTWTSRTLPNTYNNILSLGYVNGLFVLVATLSSSQIVISSSDGITWTQRYATPSGYVSNVSTTSKINYGAGLWLMVVDTQPSTGYGTQVYFTSPDLTTWTQRSLFPNNWRWSNVSFINDRFYVSSQGDSTGSAVNTYLTSLDGLSWSQISAPGGTGSGLQFSYLGGIVYTSTGYRSFNLGQTWVSGVAIFPVAKYGAILFGTNTSFVYELTPSIAYQYPGVSAYSVFYPSTVGSRVVFGSGTANFMYTLDMDVTKFRSPLFVPTTEIDRYYIKAK